MAREFDAILSAHALTRRYTSLTQAGIDITNLRVPANTREMIEHWRERFTSLLASQFAIPEEVRATEGAWLNIEEAYEGEPECWRMERETAMAPLRIGINCSRDYNSVNVVSIRGGAIMALIELCAMRGQAVEIEVCYGNGVSRVRAGLCHVRVELQAPNLDLLTRICCSDNTISEFGSKLVERAAREVKTDGYWTGVYRFHEFPWEKAGQHEYDFVLDRIETNDPAQEEARVVNQLVKLGMMGET